MRVAICLLMLTVGCFLVPPSALAEAPKADEGFTLFFNGKNLDGWVNHDGGAALDGQTMVKNNRFQVQDGLLVIDGKTKGNLVIDTTKKFSNKAHIKFEFLPDEKCNNDLYILGLKFDLKTGSVKNLEAGKWHKFEIVANGDTVEFKCNGEVQATQKPKAEASPLGVRAEFGAVQFRNRQY